MFYRVLRNVNEIYGVVALFAFIAAFFIALAFTVIYPMVPILLVFSSIFLVVGARLGYLALRAGERALARREIARGLCPDCGESCESRVVSGQSLSECSVCSMRFTPQGERSIEPELDATTAPNSSIGAAGVTTAHAAHGL